MAKKLLDPKQELFLSGYTNPKSPTFGNALQSALKAGYSQEYAENITHLMPEWLSENMGDMNLIKKAEKVLNNTLDLPAIDEENKVDNQLISNQLKASNLVLKGLAKSKYSERTEHTGADGKDINFILNDTLTNRDEVSPDTNRSS